MFLNAFSHTPPASCYLKPNGASVFSLSKPVDHCLNNTLICWNCESDLDRGSGREEEVSQPKSQPLETRKTLMFRFCTTSNKVSQELRMKRYFTLIRSL